MVPIIAATGVRTLNFSVASAVNGSRVSEPLAVTFGRSGPSGKLDIVVSDTQGDQGAARLHSGNGRRRRAGNRRRIDDECRATEFLQDVARIRGLIVDIMMGAELLEAFGLVDTPIDR